MVGIKGRKCLGLAFALCSVMTAVLLPTFATVGSAPSASVTSGCSLLAPRDVPRIGLSGAIRFDCTGKAAFSALGSAIPIFNLSTTGYGYLAIVLHSASSCSLSTPIQSGLKVAFSSLRHEYDYCTFFADPSQRDFRGFDIGWNVGRVR